MYTVSQSSGSVKVFYSYAHEDEELRKQLENHLASLKQEGLIEDWHDRKITAGDNWADRIDEHLESANLILLLVSSDFMSSNYCSDIEVRRAMEKHSAGTAHVIPIILRLCDWTNAPFGQLQALPQDGIPVKDRRRENEDEAFFKISLGIRQAIKALRNTSRSSPKLSTPEAKISPKFDGIRKFEGGYFSKIDTVHIHIDGGSENELIQRIVQNLNGKKIPSKLTAITRVVEGPQRRMFPETYRLHTPGIDEQEQLEYFSTTLLPSNLAKGANNDELVKRELKLLLAELSGTKGIVIEVERVVGKIGEKIEWSKKPVELNKWKNLLDDIGFSQKMETMPIEIHYAVDIQKEQDWQEKLPLELHNLPDICTELGIQVGGWFLFDKGQVWAYRSNSFVNADISPSEIKQQRDVFAEYLDNLSTKHNFKYQINVLVEQALGVLKTPLERTYPFKTVKELAEWEGQNSSLEKFWVVAPNFLGDKNEEVRGAMIQNLRKGVEYTYFLRSYADFQRLQKFARTLEKELSPGIDISQKMNAVLFELSAESRNKFNEECFIANPHKEDREGYQLIRYRETGEVFEGKKMELSQINSIINLLKPLFEHLDEKCQLKKWMWISIKPDEKPKFHVLICTDLENCAESNEPSDFERKWVQMLRAYDLIVAEEVSKLGGIVVKIINDGYLIIFEESESTAMSALNCAERLRGALQEFNTEVTSSDYLAIPRQRIAIDCGEVAQVIRAHGNDIVGEPLNRCKQLLEQTEYGKIYMTKCFFKYIKKTSYNDLDAFTGLKSDKKWLEENIICRDSSPSNGYYELL